MRISLTCPACGQEFTVKEERAGRRVGCKHCAAIVSVPRNAASQTSAPPATPLLTRGNRLSTDDMANTVVVPAPSQVPRVVVIALILLGLLSLLMQRQRHTQVIVPPSDPFSANPTTPDR